MNTQEQPMLHNILEEYYDVQLELEDLIESYEFEYSAIRKPAVRNKIPSIQ